MMALAGMQASCTLNSESDEHFNNPPDSNNENLLYLISANENYSRFYNALIEYGFDELLSKNQYFTVFIPPNSAFEGLPEYTAAEWEKILGFNIVYANLYFTDFRDIRLMTVNGK